MLNIFSQLKVKQNLNFFFRFIVDYLFLIVLKMFWNAESAPKILTKIGI